MDKQAIYKSIMSLEYEPLRGRPEPVLTQQQRDFINGLVDALAFYANGDNYHGEDDGASLGDEPLESWLILHPRPWERAREALGQTDNPR